MNAEELLTTGKIQREDYEVFVLFEQSEIGKKFFDRMVNKTFMDQPAPHLAQGEIFAFMDGRRDVFRQIRNAIDKIYKLMTEGSHD